MYEHAAKSYQQAYVFTAKPMKLVIMCYDEAIGSLKLARESYVAREYEAKAKTLLKTVDIIHEVNSSLDMGKGGGDSRESALTLPVYDKEIGGGRSEKGSRYVR